MATRTAATNGKIQITRGVLDAQPIPAPRLRSQTRTELKKETRFYTEVDGHELANWLNAASGTKSFDRVKGIITEVQQLTRDLRSNRKRMLRPAPLRSTTPEQRSIRAENTKIIARHEALNKNLARYVFRPRATWFWGNDDWLLGLLADELKNEFINHLGHRKYGEADAVMAVVRLTGRGYQNKIVLCTACRNRWRYAAKSHYRFCTDECREAFYAKDPEYHSRKAETQRAYRDRLKRKEAS